MVVMMLVVFVVLVMLVLLRRLVVAVMVMTVEVYAVVMLYAGVGADSAASRGAAEADCRHEHRTSDFK